MADKKKPKKSVVEAMEEIMKELQKTNKENENN